jgi:predicted phage terminase large subunit-like protein
LSSKINDDKALSQSLSVTEIDAIRAYTKQSFYGFVQEFWDVVIPEDPVWNWHIEYLCNELQFVAERVFDGLPKAYDLIINISPGSTKSTLCSIMFPAWCWTRMPSARLIGASYTHNLAMDLSRKNRDVVLSDKFRQCFPEIQLRDDQSAKSYFINKQGGSRYSVGVGGSVTGLHGHFLIVDDPLDPNKAISEAELKTANRWMKETLPTRKVDKLITPTILIMQRLHQDDCAQNMIDRAEEGGAKIRHICLPGEITPDVKPVELRARYIDGLMDVNRLNRAVLKEMFVALGEYGYAGQILQRPVPLGGGMFKTDKIRVVDAPPYDIKRKLRYWDKAASHNKGAYTVGALLCEDVKGGIGILDIQRGQWEMHTREAKILSTAQVDGRKVRIWIEQEPGSGGKDSAEWTVANLRGFRAQPDKVGSSEGSKELRAEPFASQVNAGNVWMVRSDWNREYLNELSYFPFSKYKDQTDASSGAFNKLTKKRTRVGAFGRK